MSKKQLIVAADVRLVAKSADKRIHLQDPKAIVTAEARSLAKELGVELSFDPSVPVCDPPPSTPVDQDAVRRVIEAQTHGPASEAVLAEVLRRIAQQRDRPADAPGNPQDDAPEPAAQVAQTGDRVAPVHSGHGEVPHVLWPTLEGRRGGPRTRVVCTRVPRVPFRAFERLRGWRTSGVRPVRAG